MAGSEGPQQQQDTIAGGEDILMLKEEFRDKEEVALPLEDRTAGTFDATPTSEGSLAEKISAVPEVKTVIETGSIRVKIDPKIGNLLQLSAAPIRP